MSKPRQKQEPFGGLQLAGDALCLLRSTPSHILARYLIGTVPFILGLLFFAVDMTRSAFAPEHSAAFAALLAILFVWMKCWQTAFMIGIQTEQLGHEPVPWSLPRILRLALLQTAIQPLGFILMPPALLLGIPFPAIHNLFQNLTLLADGQRAPLSETLTRAWRLAILWPGQALTAIWLASPWLLAVAMAVQFGTMLLFSHFLGTGNAVALMLLILTFIMVQFITSLLCPLGVLIAANIGILLLAIPWVARHLFGLPWHPATDSPGALLNDSFFLATFGLTFLVLDPLMKAITVLRCFHGEAVTSGADIRLALRRPSRSVGRLAILAILITTPLIAEVAPPASPAATPRPAAQQLDTALDTALASPEYAWRLPRERKALELDLDISAPSWFGRMLKAIEHAMRSAGKAILKVLRKMFEFLEDVLEWLADLLDRDRDSHRPNPFAWMATTQGIFLIIAMALLAALVVLLLRLRLSQRTRAATPTATPTPDLTSHFVSAADLPTNEWLELAETLIRDGQLRLALRAIFLGVLAELGQHRLLGLTPYKSNRDYRRELHRRVHDRPALLACFRDMINTLECAWYGNLAVDADLVNHFRSQQREIFEALPKPTVEGGIT